MKSELYNAIKSINCENLTESEKEDLLSMFISTKNSMLRNQIAFIFSDIVYNKSIPYILQKINEKEILNKNASLVYALQAMDVRKHFVDIVKIICTQEYESRLMAFEIVENLANKITKSEKLKAIKILEHFRDTDTAVSPEMNLENSKIHFINKTLELVLMKGNGENNEA